MQNSINQQRKLDSTNPIGPHSSTAIAITILILILFATQSFSQLKSGLLGETPAGIAAGSPASSYGLSNIETVDLFSGRVNLTVPLLNINGRGSAGIPLTMNVGQSSWVTDFLPNDPGNGITGYLNVYDSDKEFIRFTRAAKIGDGRLVEHRVYSDTVLGPNGIPNRWRCGTTEIVYEAADGTEHFLYDEVTGGQESCWNSTTQTYEPTINRGNIFSAKDGSGMTFVADETTLGPLMTYTIGAPSFEERAPNGLLKSSNGNIIRFDGGLAQWIKDRNGNTSTFTYTGGVLTKITDSNNREITISGNSISYCGVGGCTGATRTISFSNGALSANLRSGYSAAADRGTLFPTNSGAGSPYPFDNSSFSYNLTVLSTITIPDGRSYRFYYNPYGEVARIETPSGAAVEYDYAAGVSSALSSGQVGNIPTFPNQNQNVAVYRRLVERREYANGGSVVTARTTYSQFDLTNLRVEVRQLDPSSATVLARSYHYFNGSPLNRIFPGHGLGFPNDLDSREIKTEGLDVTTGTVLQRTENEWVAACIDSRSNCAANSLQWSPFVASKTSSVYDSSTGIYLKSKEVYSYDQYGNLTDTSQYDFGTNVVGPFLRRSHTGYVAITSYTSATGPHLRSLPVQTWVSSDSAGATKVSLTNYEYDNYTAVFPHAGLTPRSGVSGFDLANYGISNAVRGNVTGAASYSNAAAQTGAVATFSQYDVLGNVVTTIDPLGNTSTINYADNFGVPDDDAISNSPPSQLSGLNTFAYPTITRNPMNWVAYAQYDYSTGSPVNSQDVNGVISKTLYSDPLDRPTQSATAIGTLSAFQTTTVYHDLPADRRIEIKHDLNTLNDNLVRSESIYDGLGRTIETRNYEADGGYVVTKSVPFAVVQDPETLILRAASQVTNPYRPNAGEQPVWTTSLSDSLGRNIKVVTPDGAFAKTDYTANSVIVTDQAGKQRRSISNALGQLIRVDEPTSSGLGPVSAPSQPTSYNYDTLGNLITVQQGAQSRFFLYDSLGRLLRIRQPEQDVNDSLALGGHPTNSSWTAGFAYDNNGNVLTTTDAKNVTITNNAYDALNRPASRSYSDGMTPTVNFYYDGNGVSPPPGFAKGKLTKVSNGISDSLYSQFDAAGRLLQYQQITDGQAYPSSYQYNIAGALTQETYPSGRVVKEDFDTTGKISRVYGKPTATATEQTYANLFSYFPDGKIEKLQLGNNLWEAAKLNSRLQVTELALGVSAGDGSRLKLNYEYGELNTDGTVNAAKNAGNIAKQTISFAGQAGPFVQTYKYDALDRITEAQETINGTQSWKQTFGFDIYGNRTNFSQIIGSASLQITNITLPTVDSATNRFTTTPGQGYSYDANGNIIGDPQKSQARSFTFNGDNKQTQVRDVTNGNTVIGTYYYDGDGHRVKKVTGDVLHTVSTVFVYDGMGKLVAEYSTAPPIANPTISYTATDQLGSPRVITDKFGSVVSRRDFMPFGEELYADGTYRKTTDKYGTTGQDTVRQRFTGYQKDAETGLDFAEARMYQNQHGRFTAIDPLLASGKSANPQTFNRYVYGLNRPLRMTDPSGLQAGDWYTPVTAAGEVDTSRGYKYIDRGGSTEGYRIVSALNKQGQLIGPSTILDDNHVLRFNPNGPYKPTPNFSDDGNSPGILAKLMMSDYDFLGYDTIASDAYEASSVEQPADNYAKGAELANPVNVALALTPFKFSVVGKAAMEKSLGGALFDEITNVSTLEPGPFGAGSIPARGSGALNAAEQREINALGEANGCHTCGNTNPGTKSGSFIGDHQQPSAFGPPTRIYPQCIRCSDAQGGIVKGVLDGRIRRPEEE